MTAATARRRWRLSVAALAVLAIAVIGHGYALKVLGVT